MMRVYAYIGVGAVVVGLGLYVWGLHGRLDHTKDKLEQTQAIAVGLRYDLEREREEVSRVNNLLASLETKEAEIRYVDKVVTKEVVKYRDRVINRCQLAPDWVCIANAAAQGVPASCGPVEVQN